MPLLSTLQLQRDNLRKCHTQKGLTKTLFAKTSKVGTTIKIIEYSMIQQMMVLFSMGHSTTTLAEFSPLSNTYLLLVNIANKKVHQPYWRKNFTDDLHTFNCLCNF